MKAIIDINPDADGVRCGGCPGLYAPTLRELRCHLFVELRHAGPQVKALRPVACLATTQRYQRMVEALREAWEDLLNDDATRSLRHRTAGMIDAILADEVKP